MFLKETRADKPNIDSADKFDLDCSLCQSLVQGCKSTGLQVHGPAGLHVYKFISLQVYQSTGLRVILLFYFCECLLPPVHFLWFTSSGSFNVVPFRWFTSCGLLPVVSLSSVLSLEL